jgi:hypothetical protein
MRLVIEDDSGAAWYIVEDVEKVDLTSQEGKEYISSQILDVLNQIAGWSDYESKEDDTELKIRPIEKEDFNDEDEEIDYPYYEDIKGEDEDDE